MKIRKLKLYTNKL